MSFTAKRLLIIFSVALNIGFIIMVLVLMHNHLPSFHVDAEMRLKILPHLDLSPDVEKSVVESMEKMETAHRDFVRKLHQARNETITLLSRPETIDKNCFEKLNDNIIDIMIQENHIIRKHLVEIRDQLGDEKGARFFSEFLKQVKKRHLKEPL